MIEGLLQPTHLLLVLFVALIVLGPGKLGDLGGQLGRGMREFKQNMDASGSAAGGLSSGRRFCSACGGRLTDADRFCTSCGAPQGAATS